MTNTKEKWCHVCGSKIKSGGVRLSDTYIRMAGIRNPEYWWVHKECVKELNETPFLLKSVSSADSLKPNPEWKICKDCGKEFQAYTDEEEVCVNCEWKRLEKLKRGR